MVIQGLAPDTNFCTTCHDPPSFTGFNSSAHQTHGVVCISCHTGGIHNADATSTSCVGCHADSSGNVANHPVHMGTIPCTSCHDPHTGAATRVSSFTSPSARQYCHNRYLPRHRMLPHDPSAPTAIEFLCGKFKMIRGEWKYSGHANTQGTCLDGRGLRNTIRLRAVPHHHRFSRIFHRQSQRCVGHGIRHDQRGAHLQGVP